MLAWIALSVGILYYVIGGHVPLYSPFFWVSVLYKLVRRGGPRT